MRKQGKKARYSGLAMAAIAILTMLGLGSAAAQTPGAFTPTGTMTAPRFLHTATRLADGRVLIAGGEMIESAGPPLVFKTLASAETYDPVAGTFRPTGSMTTPRVRHTATSLPDGKVLITGGVSDAGATVLAHAEIYDPNTGTFAATGDMTEGRTGHTATLLNDGRVLIAGGWQTLADHARLLASAELYDPSTGTFAATGNMTEPFADTATLLPNGKVLITRNDNVTDAFVSHAELYDPLTGTFARTGDLIENHSIPTATLLTKGKVLVAGGDIGDGDGASAFAELYDPATGTFSATGDMHIGREDHTATLLPDGTVLMVGGHNLSVKAEIYDPVTGTFRITASLPAFRESHTGTLLDNGNVLIAGGDDERYGSPDTILSSAELYDRGGPIPAPRINSASIDGKRLIVVGGTFDDGAVILINGEEQVTKNDTQDPQTTLIAKKAGKKIKPGDKLQVRNPDGTISDEFIFTGL